MDKLTKHSTNLTASSISASSVDVNNNNTTNNYSDNDINTTLILDNIDEWDNVLNETKLQLKHTIFLLMTYAIVLTCRQNVFVLYATNDMNTNNLNTNEIEYILSIGFLSESFYHGIVCIIYGYLANKYGYDTLLLIQFILQTIGAFLQSFTYNIFIFLIGYAISETALLYVGIAYMSWLAPHNMITLYLAYFFIFWVFGFLIGPLLAGFISYYSNYRTTFWTTVGISLFSVLYTIIFTLKNQKQIENKQLNLIKNYINNNNTNNKILQLKDIDPKYQFPIILEYLKNNLHENNNNPKNGTKNENAKKKDSFLIGMCTCPKLGHFQWFMLLSAIFINGCVTVTVVNVVIYYGTYLIENLNENVLISSLHIFVMCVFFMISNFIAQLWFAKFNKITNKYIVASLMSLFLTILQSIFFTLLQNPYYILFWIYDIFAGLFLGVLSMTSEILILELQPTIMAGKISGIKALIGNFTIGIHLFFVTIFWQFTNDSVFYINAIWLAICSLLAIIMYFLNKNKQNSIETETQTQNNMELAK